MSIHIGAKEGQIASRIILPGDPYRARYLADNFLEDAVCYNEVRGMLGFTGTYKGVAVSVQGTGMGMPSASIYLNELMGEYGCEKLIRIGTCGGYSEKAKVLDVILAQAASTDSALNNAVFGSDHFAPIADFSLLKKAFDLAQKTETPENYHIGGILSTDAFYQADEDAWKTWADYGVLGAEMETAALYTLAAKYKKQALSILTVSDSYVTNEVTSSETREKSLNDMITLALETIILD